MVWLSGCAVLSIDLGRPDASDWTTAGGSAARTQATPEAVRPPLVEAWSSNVEAAFGPGGAVVAGGYALIATRRGELVALDLERGGLRGRLRLAGPLDGTPALSNDLLVTVAADGRSTLSAVDLRSGTVRWRDRLGSVTASPLLLGERVVTAGLDGTVRAFATRSGVPSWTAVPDSAARFHAAPVTHGDAVLLADDQGSIHRLDAATGSAAWSVSTDLRFYDTPALLAHPQGDRLFLPTRRGVLLALDAATGSEVWRFEAEPVVRFASPAAANGTVYLVSTEGLLRALDAETGAVRWTARLDSGATAAPLVTGGIVYVGTLGGRLHAVEAATGEPLWNGALPGRVRAAPVPAAGGVLVLSEPRHATLFLPEAPLADARR